MSRHDIDDVATGEPERRPIIMGRPLPGQSEDFVLMEEPGEAILMHWVAEQKQKMPHFRDGCPYCPRDPCEPVPFRYIGAWCVGLKAPAIVELNQACYAGVESFARQVPESSVTGPPKCHVPRDLSRNYRVHADTEVPCLDIPELPGRAVFTGLIITVFRYRGARSRRVVRSQGKRARAKAGDWPYDTRMELARIWRVLRKPTIYREGQA